MVNRKSGINRFCKKYKISCHMIAENRVLYILLYLVQRYVLVDY